MAILVIKLKHIGDVLLATPALRHLKAQLGTEPISMLVRGGTEVALAGNPDVHDVFSVGSLPQGRRGTRASWAENWRLFRWLRRGNFRAVIDFSASDRGAICGLLTGARQRITYDNPETGSSFCRRLYSTRLPYGDYAEHQVVKDLKLAGFFTGATAKSPRLRYEVTPAATAWAEKFWSRHAPPGTGIRRVVCHPTSRWMFKCWERHKMARVVCELVSCHRAHVVITHGAHESETSMAREIAASAAPARPELADGLSFDQLAALLKTADVFLGIDTAPMHLAAAVGTKVVALFGPSPPERWRPWCDAYRVLHQPCACQTNRNLTCPKSAVMQCLQAVSEAQVLAAVREVSGWQ
ncbi:MAG: putative lipopolysaccharide heptosyltransferase III [Pedosphaera sp. Tous-C6FEB]|nr:MAG: putative lipopolysaccharide heptosyltransferase III [Pedosphaera sp. Tous-C6FEB]